MIPTKANPFGYKKFNISSFKVFGSSLTNFKLTTKRECVVDFGDGTIQNFSGTDENITHNYSSEAEYIITITGNHSTFQAPSETIKAIQLSNTITNCGQMFYGCSSLTTISETFTIPNSVTMCWRMFYGCSSLTTIPSTLTIPNSVIDCSSMFFDTRLTEIPSTFTIPNSVTYCSSMFRDCSSLTEIPSTLTIGNSVINCTGMFYGCSSLTTIPSTFTIPNSVTDCSYMFYRCSSLISDISNILSDEFTATSIKLNYMFYRCSKITGTAPADKLWNSNKTFESVKCFYNCTSLTNYDEIPATWK